MDFLCSHTSEAWALDELEGICERTRRLGQNGEQASAALVRILFEALGFVARGVLMPGHFYVRQLSRGSPRHVELLRRGEAMSDDWYR